MKTDSLFYRLFQTEPSLALELAGLAVPEPHRYRFVSLEVKQTAFRLDGFLEPPADRPAAPLVFVEAQAQPDDGFYLRQFGEAMIYLNQYPSSRPWHMVVFYPDATVERINPMNQPLLALPNLHRVYLNQLPLLDSPNPKHWLISLILAKTAEIPAIVRRVQNYQSQNPGDGVDWLDLLETILVYKLPKLTREEIQKMFGFNDVDLKQTAFYREAFGEGRTEGEAIMLNVLLESRFGPLSEETKQRLNNADANTLLIWGKRVLEAKTLADIFLDG